MVAESCATGEVRAYVDQRLAHRRTYLRASRGPGRRAGERGERGPLSRSLWQPQDDFNVAFLSRLAMAVARWLGHGRCEVHLTLAVSSLSLCAMRLLHSGNLPEALALQGEPPQSYDLHCGTQSLSRLRAKEPR